MEKKSDKDENLLDFYLWDFATSSLRDNSDKEYIAARSLYKLGLIIQFLWFAQQSIEKYLKSILLYNKISTKRIGHKLKKAVDSLEKIKDIKFDIPDDVYKFIEYIDKEGNNRYFDKRFSLNPRALIGLDRTVWYIRRYCDNYHYDNHDFNNKLDDSLFRMKISSLQNEDTIQNPQKFRLKGGFLEKIIEGSSKELRNILVWNNFYFGKRKRKKIRNYKFLAGAGSPTPYYIPKAYTALKQYIDFSEETRRLFEKNGI